MKRIKILLKWMCAGAVAVCVLSAIFACYVFTPVHKANPKGNTDYIWSENTRWFKMTEGISTGKFDANGYNNIAVVDNPSVLVLGSSHMESTDVPQDKNTAYQLQQLLGEGDRVYNMGISSHNFIKVCEHLPTTLALYEKTPEYIIIETSTTQISQKGVDDLLQGKVPFNASQDTGLIAAIQRIPVARLLYYQISNGLLDLFMPQKETKQASTNQESIPVQETAYKDLFGYLDDTMKAVDTKLIIFYHPTECFQEDGTVVFDTDAESKAMFAQKCGEYGITFVDMTEPFMQMYQDSQKVPHGFVTGKIGTGHLNADGHAAIAKELASVITSLRQEG